MDERILKRNAVSHAARLSLPRIEPLKLGEVEGKAAEQRQVLGTVVLAIEGIVLVHDHGAAPAGLRELARYRGLSGTDINLARIMRRGWRV